MPTKGNTPYHKCLITAQQTIDLINHRQTPDRVSDAILNVLSEMSAEYRINIWEEKTGINLATLAAFYSVLKRGAGYRRVRVKGDYKVERLKREHEERLNRTAKNWAGRPSHERRSTLHNRILIPLRKRNRP